MNKHLNIAILQLDIAWEQPEKNRSKIEKKLNGFSSLIDILVLPEMFTTGFTMNSSKMSENMNGTTISWMKNISKKYNTAIVGSIIVSEKSKYFNRLIWVQPNGTLTAYDKRHLFGMAKENKFFEAGSKKIIIDYKGWKICPLVCYDLRFPVWSRNKENFDVLIYVANWPEKRINAWDTLLKARAIENQVYAVGVNRVGKDPKDNNYSGSSAIIDPLGNYLIKPLKKKQKLKVYKLESSKLTVIRKNLPFLKDMDDFKIL
jgi:omega-amidase